MIGHDQPVRIAGVINLSPESFYKGSIASDTDTLIEKVHEMEREGVDILDIGGASTAPKQTYSTQNVSVQVELKRISEAMKVLKTVTDLPISIDTMDVTVAETALDMGAAVVNDVMGLKRDSAMAELVADRGVPVIVMANCAPPCQNVDAALDSVRESIRIAKAAGVSLDRIITDPGIGFGKPTEVDVALLRDLSRFTQLGHPVFVGVSRKAFIGELLGQQDPEARLTGTVAASALAVINGADIIRAHDVKEARIAASIGMALRKEESQV